VSIRPENIDIHRGAGAAPEDALTVTVEDRAYLGDHYRYGVRIGATRVTVTTTRPVADGRLTISLPPEDIRVFPAEAPTSVPEDAPSHEETPHASVH
jgi:iron(III) transport system ATP-binding protein